MRRSTTAGTDHVIVCGIGRDHAAAAVALIGARPRQVVVVGCAGALDPRLGSGDLVIADHVRDGDGEVFSCHPAGLEALEEASRRAGLGPRIGGVLTSASVLGSVAEKRLAAESTGCLAVDMESAAIARHARAEDLPFLVVRSILDPADVVLEFAPLCADSAGGVSFAGIGRALARGRIRAVHELAVVASARRAAARTLRRLLAEFVDLAR